LTRNQSINPVHDAKNVTVCDRVNKMTERLLRFYKNAHILYKMKLKL